MAYNLYPAVDELYNLPPEVRAALARSLELRNTIVPMSTVTRNNLLLSELWDGRVIANTTTDHLERYDGGSAQWKVLVEAGEALTQTSGDARYLKLTGGTLTNFLTLHANGTSNLHAVTKQQLDTLITSLFNEINDVKADLAGVSIRLDNQLDGYKIINGTSTATISGTGGATIAFGYTFNSIPTVSATLGDESPASARYVVLSNVSITTSGFAVRVRDSAGAILTSGTVRVNYTASGLP